MVIDLHHGQTDGINRTSTHVSSFERVNAGDRWQKIRGARAISIFSWITPFFITLRLTKPRTTTTILASCPRKHTRFKIQGSVASLLPTDTMPLPANIKVSPAIQKSGFLSAPRASTGASITGISTSVNVFTALLSLQPWTTYSPPGPRPTHPTAMARGKTQLVADQEAVQPPKKTETQQLNIRMFGHLLRLRCIVFDRGKGWWGGGKEKQDQWQL